MLIFQPVGLKGGIGNPSKEDGHFKVSLGTDFGDQLLGWMGQWAQLTVTILIS